MSTAIRRFLVAAVLAISGITTATAQTTLPPPEGTALDRLMRSSRHGEWVRIDASGGDQFDAWVVYPERSDKAPVVLVIHEIFGLSDWVRAVADQLAADGFIAIAPDFLSGKAPDGKGSRSVTADQARGLIANLRMPEIVSRLDAAARYGTSLPAATKAFGVVGYCWGGGISFAYAAEQPALSAAVVFYGTSPAAGALGRVKAPVLGLYGGADARVNATVPAAQEELARLGKRFDVEMYPGAGHAFLRQQDGSAANRAAAEKAWPRAVEFLRQALEARASSAGPESPTIEVVLTPDDCSDACAIPAETAQR
jgi:carboxymethylenebutenolidase